LGTIAVFDSGLGSLSIIKAIRQHTKADIIYFADQKNFPYGKKSTRELEKIIKNTISFLKEKFNPDLVIVGSNTPSLLVSKLLLSDDTVVGVLPPLMDAQRITKTNSIALLVTSSVARSTALNQFIKKNLVTKSKILKIDASELVKLVEYGKFIYNKDLCIKKIISLLQNQFIQNNVDVATLSSTHLPFLLPYLQQVFPSVQFLDPADKVAEQIIAHKLFSPSHKNTLRIFTTGDVKTFQTNLKKIGIKKTIQQISY
jgi:glutamate racemase